jgi:hypothetical protein
LLLASYFANGSLLAAFAASLVFGGLYVGLVKLIGVTEIDALLQSLLGLLRRFIPGMAR